MNNPENRLIKTTADGKKIYEGTSWDQENNNFTSIEELRDFLYAKAIDPNANKKQKEILDAKEIQTASPDRLEELAQLISGKKSGEIVDFEDTQEKAA